MSPGDDQRRPARIAAVSALVVVASFVASKAARDAILLASFHIKTLPIFIAISALTSLPIILVAGRLMTRFGPARLMPALNVISAGMAIGEWLLLHRYPRPIAVVVYFHLATSGAVLVSGFWSIVNEQFDVQSAKRHIGRIGVGATLGGIFGGVIAERTAVHLPADAILLVLAGLQLTCAVTLALFGGLFGGAAPREPSAARPTGTWLAVRVVARSQLLRHVGGVVILGAIAAGVMDYVFKADIVAGSSHDGLLRSLAIFYTVTNVVTAIVQVVVCGPLIARLGVPRSVATLPVTVTAFGLCALALPVPLMSAIARGAEAVTRNSIYRAGYELIYAPLPEEHKRPTKVVLDVGADRIGDMLGAQLVGMLVYLLAEPRTGLLVAALVTGVIAVMVVMRLPRSYTMALEDSLMARAPDAAHIEPPADEPEPWITLSNLPRFGQASDVAPLSLRLRDRAARRKPPAARPAMATTADPTLSASQQHDSVLDAISDLRSREPERVQRALATGLTPELAAHAIDLLGRDDVARPVLDALTSIAPRCTGMLVDALLDTRRDMSVRRRLPAVLLAGEPQLAAWGLWRALVDPAFDVRYRSGAVLSRLAAAGHLRGITTDDVFEAVRRELVVDRSVLASHRLQDDPVGGDERADDASLHRAGAGLEHVFTVLGLALPAEPLRIALHAVQTDDAELRGTALEYLESILPPDVRAQLWPLLEGEPEAPPTLAPVMPEPVPEPPPRPARSHDEIVHALHLSYPAILEKLRERAKPA
ncbi:MAG TPA: MFS transporter [Kofleriaceae bacterium]|nr:MFS transporter [Kofleriaceae bacterium]